MEKDKMGKENKYLEGEEFLEVSFELPNAYGEKKLVEQILKNFVYAVNIRIIKGEVYKQSESYQKSTHRNGITIYNTKHIKQPWE